MEEYQLPTLEEGYVDNGRVPVTLTFKKAM